MAAGGRRMKVEVEGREGVEGVESVQVEAAANAMVHFGPPKGVHTGPPMLQFTTTDPMLLGIQIACLVGSLHSTHSNQLRCSPHPSGCEVGSKFIVCLTLRASLSLSPRLPVSFSISRV
jgi:hypothetical protein